MKFQLHNAAHSAIGEQALGVLEDKGKPAEIGGQWQAYTHSLHLVSQTTETWTEPQ